MKVGITLPQFGQEAGPALDAARRAEDLGLDGVFCFDHLWPIGRPDGPVLSMGPLLGALASSTSSISLGPLVARVGLVPDEVLVAMVSSLSLVSGGRVIAGLGTGDHLSRPENEAFGLPFERADERRSRVLAVGSAVGGRGVPVWVGGGLPKTIDVARALGAAVNLWEGDLLRIAELTATGMEVTWGGPVGGSAPEVAARLDGLAAAGATWAVCAWPESLDTVARAAVLVRGGG